MLLPAVLSIWGFLGWKLYAAMREDPAAVHVQSNDSINYSVEHLVPDTYQLLLDYPDPFLGSGKVVTTSNRSTAPASTPPVHVEPAIAPATTWPEIRYAGLVKSPKDGKTVGFISVDNVSFFVKDGDALGNVLVGRIWKDSVLLTMGKEKKVVKK